MNGFAFSLAANTYLEENSAGCFLVSEVPVKMLRISRPLLAILKNLQSAGPLPGFQQDNPGIKEAELWPTLLSLTFRGYLKLDAIGEPAAYPAVSVIIPVRDQPADLVECLQSLAGLDYPAEKLEIIVVDDGSSVGIARAVAPFNARYIRLGKSQGQAVARNTGAGNAGGDILAFLDADCMADANWLRETVPFFGIEGIGAVGGFVASYYQKSPLDRYEAVSSSLNLGSRIIFETDAESNFYVPTCNMLVGREVFRSTGGFRTGMHLGEDVDFCWRMRDRGFALLYVPAGRVAHKHRNQLFKMLRRRGDYGTSESVLYATHKTKKKRVPVPVWAALSFLGLLAAVLLLNPYPLCLVPLFAGVDLYQKSRAGRRFKISLPFQRVVFSVLRSHLSFGYLISFHLMRYYLALLFGLGFLYYPLWLACGLALILTSVIDYMVRKPKLSYPVFTFFYTLEHLAYQAGVFWGCCQHRYFGSYLPVFKPSLVSRQ